MPMEPRRLTQQAAAHHWLALARAATLLLAITLVALLMQAGGHQIPVLVLDNALIGGGLIGLLMTLFINKTVDRWWYIALAVAAVIAGATQLIWSSGIAISFLVLIAVLPIGDALANIFILGRHLLLGIRDR